MAEQSERRRSRTIIAVLLVACSLFAVWQAVNHWVFMVLIPVRSMLAFHTLSLVAETTFAVLLTLYFIRILARQNRELGQLDRQKNLLVDSLVHDLRQPLTAVIGGLSSLARAGELPEPAKELAEIAQEGAASLLHMVSDLLDVTRLEAGAPILEAVEVSPGEFVREGVRPLEMLAAEKHLTLSVDAPADLPSVNGDSERLRRVVANLVGNAVKFTDPGGRISVAAAADRARGWLEVRVSDSGIGIPVEAQRHIFDKFARSDTAPRSGRVSTGLGLYFCRLTIEAHGGKIWVESMPGEGTTFRFTLPLAEGNHRV